MLDFERVSFDESDTRAQKLSGSFLAQIANEWSRMVLSRLDLHASCMKMGPHRHLIARLHFECTKRKGCFVRAPEIWLNVLQSFVTK